MSSRARPERGARRHLGLGQPARRRPARRALRRRARRSGTARRPGSTAPPTPCATATSSASRARAAALAVVGDDPSCKSSTIPSASEPLLASLHMPVFFPGSVQEVLDLGLHALACSRASGLWVGFKIVTNVADARRAPRPWRPTASSRSCRRSMWDGRPYEHVPNAQPARARVARDGAHAARPAHRARARLRARERRQPHRGRPRRLARHRRARQGLLRPRARAARPRPRRPARSSAPASASSSSAWSRRSSPRSRASSRRGLDEILVAEEKGPFVETLLKEALYGTANAPRVARQARRAGRAAPRRASSTSTPT